MSPPSRGQGLHDAPAVVATPPAAAVERDTQGLDCALWCAGLVSYLGQLVGDCWTVSLHLASMSGVFFQLAAVLVAMFVPRLFSYGTGRFVDRWDRRRTPGAVECDG